MNHAAIQTTVPDSLLAHPIHERLRLNQTERVNIATSTFPGTSVMWHVRFWKAAEDGLFMTTVNKTG
jgi:hypothetical protein